MFHVTSREQGSRLSILHYSVQSLYSSAVQHRPLCQYTPSPKWIIYRARNGLLQNLVQLYSLSLSLLLVCVHLHLAVLFPEGGTSVNPQLPCSRPQAKERIELRKFFYSWAVSGVRR